MIKQLNFPYEKGNISCDSKYIHFYSHMNTQKRKIFHTTKLNRQVFGKEFIKCINMMLNDKKFNFH